MKVERNEFNCNHYNDSHANFLMKMKEQAQVDWLGRFVDFELQLKYEKYCSARTTPLSFFILASAFLLWAFFETSASLTIHTHFRHEIIFGMISFLLILICLGLGSFLLCSNHDQEDHKVCRSTTQLCFTIVFNALFVLKLLKYFFLDPDHCVISPLLGRDHDDSCHEDYHFADNFLPAPEMILIISLLALLLQLFFHQPHIHFVAFHLIITFCLFLYCIHHSKVGNILPLLFTEGLIFALFIQIHFDRMENFLHSERYEMFSMAQEKYEEIRQMVGNVAHDLKTVSSFHPPSSI